LQNKVTPEKITGFLLRAGFSPANSGFKYLHEAIVRTVEDPALFRGITKVLYPNIAKKYHVKPNSIERCIRHAILRASETESFKKTINPFYPTLDYYCPTNREFLSLAYEMLSNDL